MNHVRREILSPNLWFLQGYMSDLQYARRAGVPEDRDMDIHLR